MSETTTAEEVKIDKKYKLTDREVSEHDQVKLKDGARRLVTIKSINQVKDLADKFEQHIGKIMQENGFVSEGLNNVLLSSRDLRLNLEKVGSENITFTKVPLVSFNEECTLRPGLDTVEVPVLDNRFVFLKWFDPIAKHLHDELGDKFRIDVEAVTKEAQILGYSLWIEVKGKDRQQVLEFKNGDILDIKSLSSTIKNLL